MVSHVKYACIVLDASAQSTDADSILHAEFYQFSTEDEGWIVRISFHFLIAAGAFPSLHKIKQGLFLANIFLEEFDFLSDWSILLDF